MADLTSVDAMLKEVWPDSFETAFSNEIVALSRIERTSEGVSQDISGRYTVVPLQVGRNHGIGSRAERGVLPTPGNQQYVGTRVTLRHQYGVGDITSQALKLADREPRSFINTLDRELSGLKNDLMKDYARQVYNQQSGVLATVNGAPAANVITVDGLGTQYIEVGMILDSVTVSGPTVTNTGMEVTAVDRDAKTITVDDDTGVLDNDILVRSGSYNQEINGFTSLVDDTLAVQNLDPANEEKWKSVIKSEAAHAYSEVEIINTLDFVRRNTGKEISVMFTDFGVRRAIFADLVQQRQYHNTVEFGHGFSALPFNYGAKTIPIVEDPDYPTDYAADGDAATTGSILGLCEDTVKVYREAEGWHFAEETGSMFLAKTDRSDAWEFRVRQFSQLGINQRNCHFRINNINTAN